MSVATPLVIPYCCTVAPMRGSPLSSTTVPVTVMFWENAHSGVIKTNSSTMDRK